MMPVASWLVFGFNEGGRDGGRASDVERFTPIIRTFFSPRIAIYQTGHTQTYILTFDAAQHIFRRTP